MHKPKAHLTKIAGIFLGWFLLLSVSWTWGQSAQSKPPQATDKPAAEVEHQISPAEAQDLFHSVDKIMQFASTDTGLPIKQEVKRQLINRDEVVGFIQKSMAEDKDAQRLNRAELVLKKFGLLPRDFNMQKFLIALLREQVAGYYDPKTKTVNLLNWIEPVQQRPVLAHELTHALQDQSFNLKKWLEFGDELNNKKNPTPADIQNDEISTARQAVVEGQAMAVLVDYMLAPTGRSLKSSPQIVAALKEGMLASTADSVEMQRAPNFIRQSLTFPYRYGLDFVAALLADGGKARAFEGALAHPPGSTREIMEPSTYLSGEKIAPLPVPDLKRIFQNYERFDIGSIGEFDTALLIEQYAGMNTSQALSPHWRGGYYYAVRPKGNVTAPLGLLYLSRWSNAESASQFAAVYARSFPTRYEHVHGVAKGGKSPLDELETLKTLTGDHAWLTEDGAVVVDVHDDTVMVTESLDALTSDQLEQEFFAVAAAK